MKFEKKTYPSQSPQWVLSQYTPTKKKNGKKLRGLGRGCYPWHNAQPLSIDFYKLPHSSTIYAIPLNFSDLHCWDDNVRLTNQYANSCILFLRIFRRNLNPSSTSDLSKYFVNPTTSFLFNPSVNRHGPTFFSHHFQLM